MLEIVWKPEVKRHPESTATSVIYVPYLGDARLTTTTHFAEACDLQSRAEAEMARLLACTKGQNPTDAPSAEPGGS